MEGIIMFSIEQSIVNRLILESLSVKNPGLLHGQMGIILSLYDYGRRKNNKILIDFADELIDILLLDHIEQRTNYDFATGLSGIGWGIEYLSQNMYVECDTNFLCAELDSKIMQISIERMNDLSIETGFEGILHYVLARHKGANDQGNPTPFKKSFLEEIQYKISCLQTKDISNQTNLSTYNFMHLIDGKPIDYKLDIKRFCNGIDKMNDIVNTELGLRYGLAGELYRYK